MGRPGGSRRGRRERGFVRGRVSDRKEEEVPLESIHTEGAPRAIGPYSQAVRAGDWLFLSGQVGVDPATGRLAEGGFGEEVRRALANLRAVLQAAGQDYGNLVRVTVYLTDLSRFPEMNRLYEEAFGEARPARVTVGASALPLGAQVEMEAVAVRV